MDRFPEAFRRFEQDVDISNIESFRELAYAFSYWAGKRWVDSYGQNIALRREAQRIGIRIEIPSYHQRQIQYQTWRHETVIVRGKSQDRYRDLQTGRFIKKP
jgi:hypothetical protein